MSRTVSGVVCESVSGEVSGRNGCEFPKDSSPYTHSRQLSTTYSYSLTISTHTSHLSLTQLTLPALTLSLACHGVDGGGSNGGRDRDPRDGGIGAHDGGRAHDDGGRGLDRDGGSDALASRGGRILRPRRLSRALGGGAAVCGCRRSRPWNQTTNQRRWRIVPRAQHAPNGSAAASSLRPRAAARAWASVPRRRSDAPAARIAHDRRCEWPARIEGWRPVASAALPGRIARHPLSNGLGRPREPPTFSTASLPSPLWRCGLDASSAHSGSR